MRKGHTYDQDYRLTDLDEGSVLDRSYGYSLVNNIVSITNHLDTSRSQTFGYDPLQRLTDATGVYGDIDYSYDAVGNRLTRAIVDATGTLSETYAYDTASNRLLSVTRDEAGTVTTRTLGYTAGGNITSDSGHDGVAATYTYNDRNRYTALAKGAVSADYEHNALGQRVRKTVDGATTHFHYDTSGQLIAESDDTGGVLREYLYADGRRLAMAAVPSGGTPEILTLDSEDPSATVVGNWKSSSAGGGYLGTQYETHKKANSATAWVIWPFSLTTSGDYEVYARWVDHPKRATNATYTIDNGAPSQSVPVDQTANGGAWQLLGAYTLDAAQAVTVTLANDANDTVVADGVELRKIGGSTAPALFYYHNDHLGTPQRLTDASGGLAWDADYEPFGETDELTSSVSQALRFPGQYADGETGFNYNYFRTYDPSIGRYTQSDPIGLRGGMNTYAYVLGNPLSGIDPDGQNTLVLRGAGTISYQAATRAGAGALGAYLGTQVALSLMSPANREAIENALGDSAALATDHPSHADEREALSMTGAESCAELAWAINVLKEGIAWRRTDLDPRDARTGVGAGHRTRIANMESKLSQLQSIYNVRCGDAGEMCE